jgi:hypothetical protein
MLDGVELGGPSAVSLLHAANEPAATIAVANVTARTAIRWLGRITVTPSFGFAGVPRLKGSKHVSRQRGP